MLPLETLERAQPYSSRPCTGSQCTPTDCFLNQRSITAVMWVNSDRPSARPFPMPCHFARQPRQHVAVACCAMNTGCPLKGVCLPSLTGLAAPKRFDRKSSASASTAIRLPVEIPKFLRTQPEASTERRFAQVQEKLLDIFRGCLPQSRVTVDARTTI
jgi:hypothetical protein